MDEIVDDIVEVAEGAMKRGMRKSLGLAGVLSGVFGFIADVLQPIAPFAMYLFLASLVLLVIFLVLYFKSKKGMARTIVALVMTVVLGGVTLVQRQAEAEESGVVSKIVPGIKELQVSVGLLQETTESIKLDTEEIKRDTVALRESSELNRQNTERLLDDTGSLRGTADSLVKQGEQTHESLDEIDKKLDGLSKSGGLVAKPSSAEEFYHNAKIYELNGDYGNARRSYKSYFGFKTGKLDPHLRLTDFLRVNEGRNGAREMYTLLVKGNETSVTKYVKLLLIGDSDTRKDGLISFQKEHPEFAPVYYHLSKEFSLERLGKQSFADKRQEYKWLSKTSEMKKQGKLVKYMVDKQRLLEWERDVDSRLKLAHTYIQQLKNPISSTWMVHNHGITGVIVVSEATLDIEYRQKGKGDFRSLGHQAFNDPRTGKPSPQTSFQLQKDQEPTEFEVRYTDASGVKSEVHTIRLEEKHVSGFQKVGEKIELDKNAKNICEMTKTSWVSYREFNGKTLIYFTAVLGHRGLLTEIRYGLDAEVPNLKWKFPEYKKAGFAPIDAKVKIYRAIPKDTKFVTCQVVYKDGTKSEVMKFKNTNK